MSAPVQLYHVWLVPDRPGHVPLVLLHGFTGDVSTWAPLVASLGPSRPILALDLTGHGRSPAPAEPAAYTMPAVIDAVLSTIRDAGVERAHWVGYSMGGRVALQLAFIAREAVATLTLIGTSPGLDDPDERAMRVRADEAMANFILSAGLDAFVDRWMSNPLFASQARLGPDWLSQARAQRLTNRPAALAQVLRGMGTGAMTSVGDRLGDIAVPVLLVAGAEDAKFSALADWMAERLPAATVARVPGAGHAVQVEAPAALATILKGFLERSEAM